MAFKEKIRLDRVILLVVACVSLQRCFSLDHEGLALLRFRRRITEDPFGILSKWNSLVGNPCHWHGVTCYSGKVTALLLSGNAFSGDIPERLGGLKKWHILDTGHNFLSGKFASSLGKLAMLQVLILDHNCLEGNIPAQFSSLIYLEELSLRGNYLTATLTSSQFGYSIICKAQLSSIFERFRLNKESFEGLCELKGLGNVDISHSLFIGKLPVCMLDLTRSNFDFNCLRSSSGLTMRRSAKECGKKLRRMNIRKLLLKSPRNSTYSNDHSPESLSPYQNSSHQVQAGSVPHKASEHSSTWLYGLISALPGFAAFLLVLLALCVFCYRRRSAAVSPWKAGMSGQLLKTFAPEVSVFQCAELQAACEDFSNIIETSPENVVFKGTLQNGKEVAVSKLKVPPSDWTSQSEVSFRQKIEGLARMNHKQLVNLVGYCAAEDPFERMLVFEYAPNGTVFDQLHNGYSETLDWSIRMRIVMGAAYGLEYMHHDLVPPMSHSNFDSNAVHLTEDFSAKLADFGFSKSTTIKIQKRQLLSDFLYYDDYDYSDGSDLSFKTDIFNFGVFLLEVITGRTPYSDSYGYLVEWALKYLLSAETVLEMVDPSLKAYNCQQVYALCDIIHLCIQSEPSKRPSMKEVTSMLSKALNISPEAACEKSSPLLWAELEILAPM